MVYSVMGTTLLPASDFKLSSKADCTNWSTYMNQHMKTKGSVTKKEHTAFLNLWLEHFIFYGPSLAPTKNYLPLAYHLAHGNRTSLGKLFSRRNIQMSPSDDN